MNPPVPSALPTNSTAPPAPVIRVALVEDDPVQRSEITQLLGREAGLELAGTWGTAEAAMAAIPRLEPDVALVDIGLPGQSGIELVSALKPLLPATQFMMLTVWEDPDRIFSALEAGAAGYLLKKTAPAKLLEAIQELHAGGSPMSGAIARKVVERFQKPPPLPERDSGGASGTPTPLSPREREILELLAQGRLYKEIADALGIGYGTLRTHLHRIYEKLHARNRTEAVRRANLE